MWGYIDTSARGRGVMIRQAGLPLLREICCHRRSTKGLGSTVGSGARPIETQLLGSCMKKGLLWRRGLRLLSWHAPIPAPSIPAIGPPFGRRIPRHGRSKARSKWGRHGWSVVYSVVSKWQILEQRILKWQALLTKDLAKRCVGPVVAS